MKRWLLVALAAVVLLAAAPLAFAGDGGGWAHGHQKFQVVGRVLAADLAAGTVTVTVKAGTRTVTRTVARGGELTLHVLPETRVRLVTDEGCVTATLDQILPGAKIKAGGKIDPLTAEYIATRLKAKGGAPLPPPEPAPEPAPDLDPDPPRPAPAP